MIGATTAWQLSGDAFLVSLAAWVFSDALGILIFTPFFLAVFKGDYATCILEKTPIQLFETTALLTLTFAAACMVFFVARNVPIFILFIPTMLVTIRLGQLGTKAAVMLIALIGIASTYLGGGLIYRTNDYEEQILILQIFLFVLLFSSLPVAADLTARGKVVAALGRREKELTHIAKTDSLTGLMNRTAFVEHADQARSESQGRQSCLITIDVDHFKRINDSFGHHAGDDALRHLATVAKSHLRSHDMLGRIGGDEFMLLLPDTGIADAEQICTRIRDSLRRSPLILEDGTRLLMSVSCGIASFEVGSSFAEVSRQADFALYEAKKAGRGIHRRADARTLLRSG